MSPIEEACRWSLVWGYVRWRLTHRRDQLCLAAYATALGLRADPPHEEEP